MDLTGGTQVRMPGTRHKFHSLRNEKILDGYDNFNPYIFVISLRATTNFGFLDVWRHIMTPEASRVVSRIYHHNKNTTVLSTLFVP